MEKIYPIINFHYFKDGDKIPSIMKDDNVILNRGKHFLRFCSKLEDW